jgi:multisubunit Na+/H+ antiporter MnhE subunit
MHRKQARELAESAILFFLEFAAFFGLWLLFENQTNYYELLIGTGAALFGAIGTEIARRHHMARFRPRLRWVLEAWRLPWYVLEGCAVIIWVLIKHPFASEKSVLRSLPFDSGDDGAASAARRALAIAYTTTPPNFVVLSIDLVKRLMVVHQVRKSPTPTMTRNLGALS